ncbi:MAG: aldehyde dehydrogenase family protein [Caulobacteraceae bacterium]|nr:aldehyde dehydrogenase family protein [Caulobacteraceae bacterium]
MREHLQFYIGGAWVDPGRLQTIPIINPATEEVSGHVSLASAEDVDRAVHAARNAFAAWSQTSRSERLALFERIIAEYQRRMPDLARAVTEEMGAPIGLSERAQVPTGLMHLVTAMEVLKTYEFERPRGTTLLVREPIGVCGFITPWNWPLNQISAKVAPALATGCTMVLKPSEISPYSAVIWAEVMDAAGVPAGVFNLVQGDGPTTGAAIASHPDVDMVSFTGSTRAGVEVARAAAPTVKRVHQELGGKSPNIVLDDADVARAVTACVRSVMNNSGQSCNAPTRLLVPRARLDEAEAAARAAVDKTVVGDPNGEAHIGPVVSRAQWEKIQQLILAGVDEGALLVAGGPGRPEGLSRGWYVRPTVFSRVDNSMRIAREEIFGPVLCILPYDTEEDAVRIGNDTPYGLAAYVQSGDAARARRVAARLRAGQVNINGAAPDPMAPFGGFKQSGNGREWGEEAFGEFLETKAVLGGVAAE